MKKTNDLTYLTVDYTYNWIKTIFITNIFICAYDFAES